MPRYDLLINPRGLRLCLDGQTLSVHTAPDRASYRLCHPVTGQTLRTLQAAELYEMIKPHIPASRLLHSGYIKATRTRHIASNIDALPPDIVDYSSIALDSRTPIDLWRVLARLELHAQLKVCLDLGMVEYHTVQRARALTLVWKPIKAVKTAWVNDEKIPCYELLFRQHDQTSMEWCVIRIHVWTQHPKKALEQIATSSRPPREFHRSFL